MCKTMNEFFSTRNMIFSYFEGKKYDWTQTFDPHCMSILRGVTGTPNENLLRAPTSSITPLLPTIICCNGIDSKCQI